MPDINAASTPAVDAATLSALAADDPSASAAPVAGEAADTISSEAARKLRSEAQSLRARLREMENTQLTETEKLKRDLAETQQERDSLKTERQALRAQGAARDAGAIYPDLVATKIPDEALGNARALKAAIDDLREAYPDMFRAPHGSGDGAAGRRSAPVQGDMNKELLRAFGR